MLCSSHHSGAIGVVAAVKRCGGRDHSHMQDNSFLLTLLFLKMVDTELGIGIVAYSSLGRGFFSVGSKLLENLSKDDFRQSIPRFQPENLAHNVKLFDLVNEIAQRKGCTPSQLALAWVNHQGDDICPIPGMTKIVNFKQNIGAVSVKLTPKEMVELESIAFADNVKSGRVTENHETGIWRISTPPYILE
ncbi:hypothetical protein NL676_021580 [Syzygium grande]|nr:hypothetical protein NL676_021580 [Syzygium grande]